MSDAITLQQGFSDEFQLAAAHLYDAAFGSKLSIAIPDLNSRMTILREALRPEFSFVAITDGQLVGIAGFKTAYGSFTGGISFKLLHTRLGLLRTIRAVVVLSLFERKFAVGQLLMDGIAVSPDMRGKGIGTMLLDRLKQYARDEGYRTLRLDVINTNPAARRLYERVGFAAIKTERFVYLKWLLGFEAATQMEYDLKAEV